MAKSILLQDASLLRQIQVVRLRRGDGNLTKTTCDLLRERLMELRVVGDPAAEELPQLAGVSSK